MTALRSSHRREEGEQKVFRFSLLFLLLIARDGEVVKNKKKRKKIRSLYEYSEMGMCSRKGRAFSRVTEGEKYASREPASLPGARRLYSTCIHNARGYDHKANEPKTVPRLARVL